MVDAPSADLAKFNLGGRLFSAQIHVPTLLNKKRLRCVDLFSCPGEEIYHIQQPAAQDFDNDIFRLSI